jgi:hypothetical protein
LDGAAGIKSWPALKRAVEERNFPPGFYVSARRRAWEASAVEEWVKTRAAKASAAVVRPPLKGAARMRHAGEDVAAWGTKNGKRKAAANAEAS